MILDFFIPLRFLIDNLFSKLFKLILFSFLFGHWSLLWLFLGLNRVIKFRFFSCGSLRSLLECLFNPNRFIERFWIWQSLVLMFRILIILFVLLSILRLIIIDLILMLVFVVYGIFFVVFIFILIVLVLLVSFAIVFLLRFLFSYILVMSFFLLLNSLFNFNCWLMSRLIISIFLFFIEFSQFDLVMMLLKLSISFLFSFLFKFLLLFFFFLEKFLQICAFCMNGSCVFIPKVFLFSNFISDWKSSFSVFISLVKFQIMFEKISNVFEQLCSLTLYKIMKNRVLLSIYDINLCSLINQLFKHWLCSISKFRKEKQRSHLWEFKFILLNWF